MRERSVLLAEQAAQTSSGVKRKRQVVAAACERCRIRKTKCDALRPCCTRCAGAEAECVYTVSDGQRRQDATKAKCEKMEEDFQSMRKVLDMLRHSDADGAEDLLRRMRGSDDSIAFARSYTTTSPDPSSVHPHDLLDRCAPETKSPTQSTQEGFSRHPSVTSPSLNPAFDLDSLNPTSNIPGSSITFSLPGEATFREAIRSFKRCAGKLFHVCDDHEVEASFKEVFHNPKAQPPGALSLCRLSCMAAVGCLYMKGKKGDAYKDTFYYLAKSLLDTCIETDTLRSATFCTLICMYNIMSRATVALAYVELGISLCRQYNIHTPYRPSSMPLETWTSGKRAWRTLIFFGSWISATIGYLSGNEWDLPGGNDPFIVEICDGFDLEDMVQVQMVKIAVLKRNILHININFPQLTVLTVETIKRDLGTWYKELPASIQLSNLLGNQKESVSTDLRRTIYLVHLLYLGGLMLLYRRIATQCARIEANALLGGSPALSVNKLADDSAMAAEQSARILGLLIAEDGIFERCWIVIFQAYTAGTLLLHRIAQDNASITSSSDWKTDDLDRVQKCMQVLQICGTVDPVARMFEETLKPFFDKLKAASKKSSSIPLDMTQMESELYQLVLTPFSRINKKELAGNQADDVGFALHSHVDWMDSHEKTSRSQKPLRDDLNFPVSDSLIGQLRPGRTFDEFASCGWW